MSASALRQRLDYAQALLRGQDPDGAMRIAQEILAKQPANAEALSIAGRAATMRSQHALATGLFRRAIASDPRHAGYQCLLGNACLLTGALTEALRAFERASKLAPDHPDPAAGLAESLERLDRLDAAESSLTRFIAAERPTPGILAVHARILARRGRHEEAVALIDRALERPDIPSRLVRHLTLLQARSLDRLGRFEGAFDAASRGKMIRHSPWDRAAVDAQTDAMITACAPEQVAKWPKATNREDRSIFVVGMPRSGSTLVEQVIASHPLGAGAGETHDLWHFASLVSHAVQRSDPWWKALPDLAVPQLDALAEGFLAHQRTYTPKAKRLVDKSLENHELIPLITRAFPAARIIHVRRERLDNLLSCFLHDLDARAHPYADSFEDLAHFHARYERLMARWRELPGVPLLEIEYERLVREPATSIRAIVDFAGLPWDDRCLRPHEARREVATISYSQVSQPIYDTSIGRARHYEAQIRAALGGG